jgi:thiamine biosynthesis lipoprotein
VKTAALLALAGCVAAMSVQEGTRVPVSREAYLMGTRAALSTQAFSRAEGLATLESALAILEEAEAELSTWRPTSAISSLNRQPVNERWNAAPRLCQTLQEVWKWHAASAGAFDPAIGRLLEAWDVHGQGRVPSAEAHVRAMSLSGLGLLTLDAARCTITRRADVLLDVGAFGKGEALDRVAAASSGDPWMIDLGGQVSVGGRAPLQGAWTVVIADPRERHRGAVEISLSHGSLSTSAGSERDQMVNGTRVGHILNPRTGRPAPFNGSVTVWHERALVADILSTALFVMGPEEGLRWSADRGIAALYLVPEANALRSRMTPGFRRLLPANFTERE